LGALLASAPTWAQTSEVLTWDGERLTRTIGDVGPTGIEFQHPAGVRLVGWQHIRSIEGDRADDTAPFLEVGETAWRAISRLERGDAFGAEPLFESLFETYRDLPGPTAYAIAEGLLRCRLRREARAAAADAWLALYANRLESGARRADASPAIDPATGLAPALPPLWFDGPAARAFAEPGLAGVDAGTDAPARALDVLYRAAAAQAIGRPIDADAAARAARLASSTPGGSFVTEIVMAQIGGPQARQKARTALEPELSPGAEPWRSVWARIAVGRSLLREPEPARRREGVLDLLSVPAFRGEVSPFLTGLALADAAVGSAALGDERAARVLAGELTREMPAHPVLEWPAFRELTTDNPGRTRSP
jgi:hypothetical protein